VARWTLVNVPGWGTTNAKLPKNKWMKPGWQVSVNQLPSTMPTTTSPSDFMPKGWSFKSLSFQTSTLCRMTHSSVWGGDCMSEASVAVGVTGGKVAAPRGVRVTPLS
jgi:hypothetical protein